MAATQKVGGGSKKHGRNSRAGKFGGKRRSPARGGSRKKSVTGSRKGNYPVQRLIPNAKGEVVIVRAYEIK